MTLNTYTEETFIILVLCNIKAYCSKAVCINYINMKISQIDNISRKYDNFQTI